MLPLLQFHLNPNRFYKVFQLDNHLLRNFFFQLVEQMLSLLPKILIGLYKVYSPSLLGISTILHCSQYSPRIVLKILTML